MQQQPPPLKLPPSVLRSSASTSSRRSAHSVAAAGGFGGESPPPLGKFGSIRSQMSVQEHFALSAVDKWHRFRLPPYKLLLHLALLGALTAQMLQLHQQDGGAYARAMRRTFKAFFMPKGIDAGLPYVGGPRILFMNEGLLSSLHASLHRYYHLNEVAAVSFAYRNESDGALTLQPQPVRMRLATASDYDGPAAGGEYWLALPGDVGPFSDPHLAPGELSALLDALLEVQLEMVLCNAATRDAADSPAFTTTTTTTRCYCWRLRHCYDFRAGGQARLTLQQHVDAPCAHPPTFLAFVLSDLNWYNPLVAALAALYLTLLCKALAASVAVYLRARRSFEAHAAVGTSHPLTQRYPTWAAFPWRVKRRFFSTWLLLIFLGTSLALASALLNLTQQQNYAPSLLSHKACAGAACFLLWASALRYLEPYPKLYALVPVVNAAVARLAPFLAGFVPLFVGFALLGMALFGRGTVTFGTFSQSATTLFGMMNGDSLHNLIGAARWRDGVEGEGGRLWGGMTLLYFFAYIALAIYVVLNIIIGTTAEAFFISRRATRRTRRLLRRALRQLDAMEREQQEQEQEQKRLLHPMDSSIQVSSPSLSHSPPPSPERGGPPFRSGQRPPPQEQQEAGQTTGPASCSVPALWREPSVSSASGNRKGAGGRRRLEEKKEKEKARMRVVRGRSATLHLLRKEEGAEEDAFRTLMELLVEEYRRD